MPHDQNFKWERYQQEYTDEATAMSTFAERFRAEGRSQGIQQGMREGREQGMQRGEVAMLVRLLERKFGPVPEALRPRIEAADERSLLEWSERVLSAATLEDVFQ
jgi:flagellar biosynthesis/type III secretory pathway protein FliH